MPPTGHIFKWDPEDMRKAVEAIRQRKRFVYQRLPLSECVEVEKILHVFCHSTWACLC